ncbi:MAG: HD family hydrolase [Desulfurococcales archaeon]|nr:HD family hydrolase [Desulfurococcales archaeon]
MDVVEMIESLKWLARTGWMQRGVSPAIAESVSQHSFEAAIIALDLAYRLRDQGVDVDPLKASTLALIHDIAESVVGDIPKWSSSRMSGLKEKLESTAVNEIEIHPGIKGLFEEYNSEISLEASIARLSDYISTCIQAGRYILMGYKVEDILLSMKKTAENKVSSCCPQLSSYVKNFCSNVTGKIG